MECYLDNSATTQCFDSVAAIMTRVMCQDYGNPSSMHVKGVQAEQYLRYAKDVIARTLKVNEKEIFSPREVRSRIILPSSDVHLRTAGQEST